MKIFLASKSPRRAELLSQIGLKFDILDISCDEKTDGGIMAWALVRENAEKKACAAFEKIAEKVIEESFVIIAADTVVSLNGDIFGKPSSDSRAQEMLRQLSGRRHEVYTGVCVIYRKKDIKKFLFSDKAYVSIKKLSDSEILSYINSGEPSDKAGAYAIQGVGAIFVEKISGDYNTVVGLPISKIYNIFKKLGIDGQIL